jgi:hypothetical protein
MNCRKRRNDVKTRGLSLPWEKSERYLYSAQAALAIASPPAGTHDQPMQSSLFSKSDRRPTGLSDALTISNRRLGTAPKCRFKSVLFVENQTGADKDRCSRALRMSQPGNGHCRSQGIQARPRPTTTTRPVTRSRKRSAKTSLSRIFPAASRSIPMSSDGMSIPSAGNGEGIPSRRFRKRIRGALRMARCNNLASAEPLTASFG